MTSAEKSSRPNSAFLTTRWTRVLQSRGDSEESRVALSELCEAYYTPVFAFVLRETRNEDQARDLTQEFFARLLKRQSFGKVDPARGRFRSYLLAAVKHFLNDMRDHDAAAKRSSGQPLQSLNHTTSSTSGGIQVADPNIVPPDVDFDRKWAMALLERALEELSEEQVAEGKTQQFEILKPWLTGDAEAETEKAATALGLNGSSVKVAVHRLRRRFRDHVKQQIAATLPEPDMALVADEMSYLVSILR